MTTPNTLTTSPNSTTYLLRSHNHKFGFLRHAIQLTNFYQNNSAQDDTVKLFYLLEEYPDLIDTLCRLGDDDWATLINSLSRFRIFNALCQENKLLGDLPDDIKKQSLLATLMNDTTLLPPDMQLCAIFIKGHTDKQSKNSQPKEFESLISTFSIEQQSHIRNAMYGIKLADKISSEHGHPKMGNKFKHNIVSAEDVVGGALYEAIKSRNWGKYTRLSDAFSITMSGLSIARKRTKL